MLSRSLTAAPPAPRAFARWRVRCAPSGRSAHRAVGWCSSRSPGVGLFVELEVHEGLGAADSGDAADLVVEQREQPLVVLAHDLEQEVERTRSEHDVVDLRDPGERVGDGADVTFGADTDHRLTAEA